MKHQMPRAGTGRRGEVRRDRDRGTGRHCGLRQLDQKFPQIDLGGRPHAVINTGVRTRMVGDLQTELVADFFEGFALGARA